MFRKHKIIKNAPVVSENYDPKLFTNGKCPAVTQTVTVNIAMNDEEDVLTGCLRGLFACCMKAAKE